jgi:hypothetical protein
MLKKEQEALLIAGKKGDMEVNAEKANYDHASSKECSRGSQYKNSS